MSWKIFEILQQFGTNFKIGCQKSVSLAFTIYVYVLETNPEKMHACMYVMFAFQSKMSQQDVPPIPPASTTDDDDKRTPSFRGEGDLLGGRRKNRHRRPAAPRKNGRGAATPQTERREEMPGGREGGEKGMMLCETTGNH